MTGGPTPVPIRRWFPFAGKSDTRRPALQAHGAPPTTPAMRRSGLVALLCAVVFAGTMAAPARSTPPRAVTDNFAVLDPARWTPTAHDLGRSVLAPANVTVAGGRVALALPAGTTDGAEVRATAAYRRRSFATRIRVAGAART